MCYTGRCPYESYPRGYNEGCVCRRGKNPCPADEIEDEQAELIQEDIERDALEGTY